MNRELLYMLAIYVILRHQLFKFLSSDPRRREKLRGGNAGELEYSFLFEPAKAVGFFRVDRMSFQSFLSLQVSTQVPGELLTEVGHMCKSRVESCHVFDWLEYFFGWENTMILEVLEGTSSTNGALLPKSTFGWSLWRSVSIFQGGKGGIFIADTQPCLRCSSWLARPKWEQG